MRLTIDRRIWKRADEHMESMDSLLLDGEGPRKQCCVGIYLSALGVPDEELDGFGTVDIVDDVPEEAEWLYEWGSVLYEVNDTKGPGAEREARVASIFLAKGKVEVEFTG